ncbi:PP2C family protein-serine/threonine phosphatase [Streptomyces cinereoruber]|uniref:PP2C family protein-serine/threonine phosphatase n=1 Tax=Streptomyces cinereoruber TaxID=67260 RepID=UPI003635EC1F
MPTAGSRARAGTAARVQLVISRSLPFLVVLLTALADLLTPEEERFDRLLVAAPPLAAVTWGVRGTIGIGLLAMAVRVLLGFDRGDSPLSGSFEGETVLAVVTAASAWASRIRTRREQDLRELTAVAEVVQRVVLRPLPHRLGRFELHLLYVAAAAKARIGGDFYEAARIPGAVRVMLGDVQGKGLGAVETASVLLGAFRASVHDAPDLAALADRLDEGLARHDPRDPGSDATERFATVVLVELPDDRDVARFLSLGHPTPLLQHGSEVRDVRFAAPSLPVNLTGLADSRHRTEEVPFGPGDRMLLYTDGVSETRDRGGAFYPLEARMREWSGEPAPEFLARLHRDLAAHGAGGLDDDVAALLVVRPPDAS